MIKSMTGYGRGEYTDEKRHFIAEIKSVNHRYLEMSVRMPKKLAFFENAVRSAVKEHVERGKVDIFLSYEDFTDEDVSLHYNENVAKQYLTYLRQMAEQFQMEDDVRVSTLASFPDIFTLEEQKPDEQEVWAGLECALRSAAEQFDTSRIREGGHLKDDLLEKLNTMASYVDVIEERMPVLVQEYREKLDARLQDLLGDVPVDESRIASEVVIYADRICVDEETVRLRSHIESTKEALESEKSVGRRLDFIVQEMNREANTILSKTTDLTLCNVGINLKTDIEKVREQIQNIE